MSEEESAAQKSAEVTENKDPQPAPTPGEPQSGYDIFRRYIVLTETSLTLSKLLLLATAFLTVFLSWLAGAEPIWIAARGVIVTLAMGLTLWAANWVFTQQVMETVMADARKLEEQETSGAPVISTVERQA